MTRTLSSLGTDAPGVTSEGAGFCWTSPRDDVWVAATKAELARLLADYAVAQADELCKQAALAAVEVLDAEVTAEVSLGHYQPVVPAPQPCKGGCGREVHSVQGYCWDCFIAEFDASDEPLTQDEGDNSQIADAYRQYEEEMSQTCPKCQGRGWVEGPPPAWGRNEFFTISCSCQHNASCDCRECESARAPQAQQPLPVASSLLNDNMTVVESCDFDDMGLATGMYAKVSDIGTKMVTVQTVSLYRDENHYKGYRVEKHYMTFTEKMAQALQEQMASLG